MGRETLLILEDGLGEDHLGALADRLELDGDDGLLAARRGEVVLLVPREAENQPPWRLDLQILARHRGPNAVPFRLGSWNVLFLADQTAGATGLRVHVAH